MLVKNNHDYRKHIIDQFVLASSYAGIAFGNAGVGAVHAMSYPLGGTYHVPHGEANYQFLVAVFEKYQQKKPEGKIRELNNILSQVLAVPADSVYEALSDVLERLIVRKPLKAYGMKEAEIETFADSVITGQQRLLANNYVELTRKEIRDIYKFLH